MGTPKFSDQMWSFIFLLTGCAMILICKHFSITEDVGAGIVGAGINAYTATAQKTVASDHSQITLDK